MSAYRPRSLAADLRARDDDALAALLAARPDLLSPVPSDITSLAARATTRPSVQRALDVLDRFTLQVLDVVAALPEPVDDAAVRDALGADPAAPLAVLVAQALLFRDAEGGLLVPRTVLEVLGAPAGLGPAAEHALLTYGPRRLARLATDLGVQPTGDPVSTAKAVAAVLGDGERVRGLLADASPAAKDALETLAWGPPTGRLDNADRDVDRHTAATPVEWLLAHGLLVASDTRTVVLPREVALHLRGGRVHRDVQPVLPPHETAAVDRDHVDRAAAGAAATTVRHVEDLLELWAVEPPRVLRAGGLGVRDRSRTAAALDVDEPTLTLLVEVAQAAGLLAVGDDEVDEVWLPTPGYDDWLDLPTAGRWLVLVEAWRDSTRAAGLAGAKDPRGRTLAPLGPDLDRTLAPIVRRAVLADLATLPTGKAASVTALTARLRWRAPRRGGRLQDDLVGWTVSEAGALGVLSRSGSGAALSTPGRLLVEGDREGAREALATSLPPLLDHVLLQADLTAVAPGPLASDLARRLRLVADVESTGGATVYRFTEASVRRAFDAGWSAGDVAALLAGHSRTPVPQPLSYLVEDVARRHGRIRVGAAASFVRSDDEATLGELLTDRRAASLRLRRLAPTVLAAQAPAEVVLDRLRELGYAPAAEGADGDVMVRRPESRRTSPRRPPGRVTTTALAPTPAVVAAAVRALRAAERAAAVTVSRPTADLLAMLNQAAAAGESLWIGYVDAEGRGSQRVIDPVSVDGGHVSAYDHLRGAMRSFAVHRITGVSTVDEPTAS
ncbi:MAG TPA: helicase C-terminal domain-containing protein [Actinomycetes bacterium]|nr:helicase C-terminal domain-containing protein [Actinomycetes bacterium]